MRLHPFISRNFLRLDARRTVEDVRRLLHATSPRYLVVAMDADHYLLAARDFEERVADAPPTATLAEIGLVEGMRPAAVFAPGEAEAEDGTSLVAEDGAVTGVLTWRRGGDRRMGEGEDGAEARYVSAALPEEVFTGERVRLTVEVGTRESTLPVHLPGGALLEVMVHARRGVVVEGPYTAMLAVPGEGATARAEFWLRAAEPGAGDVRVIVLHDGAPLGSLALHPRVRPAPSAEGAAAPPLLTRATFLASAPPAVPPDLSLLILEERVDGRAVLRVRVTARDPSLELNHKEFGPVRLEMEPVSYFHAFLADMGTLGESAAPEVVRRRVEAQGERLFETLFPKELQALLWEVRARIGSVEIHSSEAWIPWELCRLTGRDEGGEVVPGPFFCEAFEVTRWIPEIPRRPRLTLENLAVVVQTDAMLPGVREERENLLSLAGGGRAVHEIPARYLAVTEALAAGTYDGFHFSGHGHGRGPDADRSALSLNEGEEMRPEDLCGVVRNLGRARPLVFLNACHAARGGVSLVGTGGWAHRWLQAGAGAFVGAYWRVQDRAACDFSRVFYREIRAGRTVGAAVRAARLAVRSDADPTTWLAYTVFCDPSAVVRG